MGPVEMKIVYDQPQFYSGQILSGHLLVRLAAPLPVTLIELRALGEGLVKFSVATTGQQYNASTGQTNTVATSRVVANHEIYLEVKTTFFQSENGQSFASGEHRYSFSVQLPPNIPGSFDIGKNKGAIASIGYGCKATLKSTSSSSKCKVKEPFMLIGMAPSPLGHVAILSEEDTRKITCCGACCWCITCGEVKATISVNNSLFLGGETVFIKANVENHSRKTLNAIRFSIMKQIDLHARGGSRMIQEDTDSFLDCDQGPIKPGAKLSFDGIRLTIPHLPSTIEGASQIMFVKYYAAVVLSDDRCCCPSMVGFRVPITIGPTSLAQVGPQASIVHPPSYTEAVVTSQPTAFNEDNYYKPRY